MILLKPNTQLLILFNFFVKDLIFLLKKTCIIQMYQYNVGIVIFYYALSLYYLKKITVTLPIAIFIFI